MIAETKAEEQTMPGKIDYKKEYKDLYLPKTKPSLIEVPPIQFIMVEGAGNPNSENSAYADAMEILYGISWTIKMSKMGDEKLEGYFEYVVPPLEGLWWIDGFEGGGLPIEDKDKFKWISMIRLPEFVTPEIFEWAKGKLHDKSPQVNYAQTRLETFEEGLCAQIMHKGPYDDEPKTIKSLSDFIRESGYVEDISGQFEAFPLQKRHHEIYLGDPRKQKPENLKTVIRHPVRKA